MDAEQKAFWLGVVLVLGIAVLLVRQWRKEGWDAALHLSRDPNDRPNLDELKGRVRGRRAKRLPERVKRKLEAIHRLGEQQRALKIWKK